MIISKENLNKIRVISRKMSKIGFGSEKELEQEILKRFIEKELKKINLN